MNLSSFVMFTVKARCKDMKTEFDYYYGAEAEQFSFVRVPKVLFTDKEHFGSLSNDARILYGFLLERMSLSRKNNWIDAHNRVYIIFPIDEIAEIMGVCHEKALNILKELDEQNGIGLVKKKRRGQGMPSIIYVMNFIVEDNEQPGADTPEDAPETQEIPVENENNSRNREIRNQEFGKTEFKKSEKPNSRNRKNRTLEFGKTECNNTKENNTEKNKTEMSYTDSQSIIQSGGGLQNFSPGAVETVESDGLIDGIDRNAVEEEVKAQIDYDCLMSFKDDSVVKMVEEIKDLMVDVLCGERTVISEGKRVSEETAKAAYRKITFEHVQYVLHSLLNYPDKISRIDHFLTTSLLNSVYTLMNSTFAGFEHNMGMKLL